MANIRRTRRRLSLACLALAALSGGCKRDADQDNAAVTVNHAEESAFNLSEVAPQPAMDRAALLQAVAQAASAAAAGLDDRNAQKGLDGKKFEVRIRFGCAGPASALDKAAAGWSIDEERRVLRIRAMPTMGADDAIAAKLAPEGVEAVEGFWLERPWLLQSACPAATVPVEKAELASTPSARVGIAQFFTANDARTGRRDHRPYEAVETLEEGQTAGAHGFDLVLSGRLQPFGDGRVIRCVLRGRDAPPDCVLSADFDRVWIEEPDSKAVIAEWRAG